MISTISLVLAFAQAPAPGSQDLQRELAHVYMLQAQDRTAEAVTSLAEYIVSATADLAGAADDASRAAALRDELELATLALGRLASEVQDEPTLERLLAPRRSTPRDGMLHARLATLGGRAVQELQPLLAWSFIGPFDNDRGQGMTRALGPELEPDGEVFDGKVREVRWRQLPVTAPKDGVVRFSRLVDPDTQCCVLARTWVYSETARESLLLLGASEELRVWVAGRPAYQALGQRSYAADCHALRVHLEAGWTQLDLKVGGQEYSPAFMARLVDPVHASPLDLPLRSEAPDAVRRVALGGTDADWAATSGVTRPGVTRRLEGASDPESLFRRALIEGSMQTTPRHLRPGLESIQAACQAAPEVLRYDLLRVDLLRERGAQRVEEDVNVWLAELDHCLEVHGDQPRFLRAKARHASEHQPTFHRARALLRRALVQNPRSVPTRVALGQVLARQNQVSLAQATWRALAADPELGAWPALAMRVSRVAGLGPGQKRRLIEVARRAGDGDALATSLEGQRLRQGDSSAGAFLARLEEHLAHHPWSITTRRGVARELLFAGHATEALGVLDEALSFAPERPALHRWRARALLALGEEERAVAALEEELRYDYSAEDERRLLEHLRSLGGAPFHEAYQEPLEQVLARSAHAAPVDPSVAGREVLLQRVVVEVNPDGTAERYHRLVQRVLSDAGAQQLDRRAFRAWPGDEEVRVLSASVLHPDGRIDEAKTGRSGHRGVVVVDLPPLAAGDVVDLEWRRDDLRTTIFGNYFGLQQYLTPDARLPVRESEVVLIVPESFPIHLHGRSLTGVDGQHSVRDDGASVHSWRVEGLEPRVVENLMPPPLEDVPMIQASSYSSWEEFGNWWWNLIEDEIRVSDEMEATVLELCAQAESPLERLRAVYDFVVTEIRYNAWEFGVHGYQPYSTSVIFSRRFGDCKDKAILLRAMLSVVDIEAWPVLVRSAPRRHEEDLGLALVSHFNHCIAYLPAQEGIPEMYLDGTARLHPLEVLPNSDRGAQVVVVRDDGVLRRRIPFPAAQDNRERHAFSVDLRGDEGPLVRYRRSPTGHWDARDRHHFTGSEEERTEETQKFLTSIFGALVSTPKVEYSDFEDLSEAVDLSFEVVVEELSRPTESGFEVPTTFEELDLLRRLAQESARQTDLLLDVPWSRETEVEYLLGEGQEVTGLPELVELSSPDVSYRRSVQRTQRGVRIREHFALETHRIPKGRYQEFRDICRRIDQAQDVHVEIEVVQ